MSSSFVWKSLTLAISVLVVSSGCFAKAFDEQCRELAESEKIKSIESRGNDIIFKFGDGSEKVFISDPFHPERGYKPKY